MYLTYGEYNELGFSGVDESEFDKLIKKAGYAVDSVTRHFYRFNNIEDDVEFRRNQFKLAVAAQVEYFNEMGGTSSHALKEPGTVTIGRTTLSSGGRGSGGQQVDKDLLVSDDVYMYLYSTGLLYRGLDVR